MANAERTFIAIKPDGVQRGLVGDIIKRFEQKGFRLVAMKFLRVRALPPPLRAPELGPRLRGSPAPRPLCCLRPAGAPGPRAFPEAPSTDALGEVTGGNVTPARNRLPTAAAWPSPARRRWGAAESGAGRRPGPRGPAWAQGEAWRPFVLSLPLS